MAQFLFAVIALIVFFRCSPPPLPENSDELFTNWFINPDNTTANTLLAYQPSIKTLDSLASIVRSRKIQPGSHAVNLTDHDGTGFTLGFSTPDSTTADTLYPLLVYLHGGIGTTQNDKGEHAYEMFRFLADTIDLFLASPSANRIVTWWDPAGLHRILKTVRYMSLHFPIDPDRIILAGVSDGATGCYAAATTVNSPFAGFIAVSGFGGMLLQFGMTVHPGNIMVRPIYNIHAGKDRLYPLTYVEQFLNWLEEQGVSVTRKIYPDEEHGFEYREKETETLVTMINTWRRPSRNTISWTFTENSPNLTDNLLSWTIISQSKESKDTPPYIRGYWNKDTLVIRSRDISACTIISSDKKGNNYFYKTAGGTIKAMKFTKPNVEQYLALMQHFCTPFINGFKIASVDIE